MLLSQEQFNVFLIDDTEAFALANELIERGTEEARLELTRPQK